MTKYCKDCVYFKRRLPIRFSMCTNTNAYEELGGDRFISPRHDQAEFCSVVRTFERYCGPDGKYFEARIPTIIDRMIDWLNMSTYPK